MDSQLATPRNAYRFLFWILATALLTPLAWLSTAGEPVQSLKSFESAIFNTSTSPSYVLITVVDDRTGKSQSFCTTANLLLGAIIREHEFPYGGAGDFLATAIAISNREHLFHFSEEYALDNIQPKYSPDQLAAARAALAPLSIAEIVGKFSTLKRHEISGSARDAIACALIERGLSPEQDDRSGRVCLPE